MDLGLMFVYSLILTLGFTLLIPLFILRRDKYAAGFRQRLGNYPHFEHDGRPVIWLHCVSVGEANAARPLVDGLLNSFPGHRLVISTTTKTGQELARSIFKDKADAVIYFPFDWKFSVRRALENYKPSLVLLMETEIWPRFIREAKLCGAKVAIVNGRLSKRSVARYSIVGSLVKNVLRNVDLALMQNDADAERIASLGIDVAKVKVTGNLKFDHSVAAFENSLTDEFRRRFAFGPERPLIVAASTHEPEERWVLNAFLSAAHDGARPGPRLLIAPRHPERFGDVAETIESFRSNRECEWATYKFVRRSDPISNTDKTADVILLDSVGELRAVYPLAEIVFVGGSFVKHGGQSILEPAAAGKAIVTGPHTHNFQAAVAEFSARDALIQAPEPPDEFQIVERLYESFTELLKNPERRAELGGNARTVMDSNRGATTKTIVELASLISGDERGQSRPS
ncbi:MAG: 3-deoxy-D-manno-octulosonic acid transferase [Acidobacteriota bacterium]